MTKPICYFLPALLMLLLPSCGKDNVAIVTSKQSLTADSARTWRLVRLTSDGMPQSIPACLADNRLTFRLNETYLSQQGATACHTGEPATYEGDWELNKSEDSLTLTAIINGQFTSRKVKVAKLTPQELRLQYPSGTSLVVETYH